MDTATLNARATTIDPGEAAARIGTTEGHLRHLRCRGEGPPYIVVGRRSVRYRLVDLAEWLEARRYTSTAEAATDA